MLWLTGILSALKGMVKVPDVVGKTTETATSDILAAYLTNTGNTTENTTDTNLGGKVKQQSPSANTLVEYDTNVSYVSYLFSFTPYSFTPTPPYSFVPAPTLRRCTSNDALFLDCTVGSCGSYNGAVC